MIYQDLHYWYDAVGNITEIQDDAQQTLYFNNSVVAPTQEFTYDALYRLMEAKGRELIGTASFGAEDNWNDAAWQTTHKGNGNAVQNYTQHYTYDEVGNILQLQHIAGTGSYTRDYTIDSGSNRMEETEVGVNTYAYTYDTRGNMSGMPHLDDMRWNATNELYFIKRGSNLTSYQYSGGQRIRKYTDKGIVKEERIYLGSFEIYRKFENSSLKIERQTVHVSDDSGRIAMYEKRTYGSSGDDNGTNAELTIYIYSNHLQSASLELDESGDIISYEEYHPYGTTSYQAMNAAINAVAKRYRYTGKERDDESGLYYHGARYYVPWLGRWTAVDPLESKYAGMSPYNYSFNNPVMFSDPSGMEGEETAIKGLWGEYKTSDGYLSYKWFEGAQSPEEASKQELYSQHQFTGEFYEDLSHEDAFDKKIVWNYSRSGELSQSDNPNSKGEYQENLLMGFLKGRFMGIWNASLGNQIKMTKDLYHIATNFDKVNWNNVSWENTQNNMGMMWNGLKSNITNPSWLANPEKAGHFYGGVEVALLPAPNIKMPTGWLSKTVNTATLKSTISVTDDAIKGAGEVIENTTKGGLNELQGTFNNLVENNLISKYKALDPNLKYGYTGSFKTGFVGNPSKSTFGNPINLKKFDIDFG